MVITSNETVNTQLKVKRLISPLSKILAGLLLETSTPGRLYTIYQSNKTRRNRKIIDLTKDLQTNMLKRKWTRPYIVLSNIILNLVSQATMAFVVDSTVPRFVKCQHSFLVYDRVILLCFFLSPGFLSCTQSKISVLRCREHKYNSFQTCTLDQTST